MATKRLPPFVQRKETDSGSRYRGWWILADGRRRFGPWRRRAQDAYGDATRARGETSQRSAGGSLEARARQWLADAASTLTPATLEYYRGKLNAISRTIPGGVAIDEVTPGMLRALVEDLQKGGASARTIQHCRRTLNRLFTWCRRRGYVTGNPVADVDWPTPRDAQPDVLTEDELQSVISRIEDPFARALVVLIAHTGLRRAEVARLRHADVDAGNASLWVRGKTGDMAHPLLPEAAAAVVELARLRPGEFVIPGTNESARCEQIAWTFRKLQKQLGDRRLHPHALRHTVATSMLRRGVSPATVQRFLRHSSYVMTQRYVHMVATDVREGLGRLRLVRGQEEQRQHG